MPNNLVLPKAGSKGGSKATSRSGSKGSRPSRQTSTAVRSPLGFAQAFSTLILGKASRVFAAFVSFHYLQDQVALPLYLFFVTLGAAACLLLLQRPWNGKRIGRKRGRRVVMAGGILALTLYIWTAGLRSAGPLRTLLVDGAELPLIYLFAVLRGRELAERRKTRGAMCMVVAYLLLMWDASGRAPDVGELEQTKFGQQAENAFGRIAHKTSSELSHIADGLGRKNVGRRRLLTTFDPPVKGPGGMKDAFIEGTGLRSEIGVLLVLSASVIMQSSRAFTRRLATELGGAKRQFALSTTAACGWLIPLSMLGWISSWSGLSIIGGVTRMRVTGGHVIGFVMVGFLWLVLPYYVRAIISTALPQRTLVQSGVVVPFVMACFISLIFGAGASAGGVSWIVVLAFIMDCIGISLMMAGGVKRSLSELPIDTSGRTSSSTTSTGQQDRDREEE